MRRENASGSSAAPAALQGKVAIITGASSGIGAAAARELVRQGCKVALAARSEDKLRALARELGPAALAVPTDVTSGADTARLVEETLKRFGRIDVLFANAGCTYPWRPWRGLWT